MDMMKFKQVMENEEFFNAFVDNLDDMEALAKLMESKGLTIEEEQLQELVKVTKEQLAKYEAGELDETDLDDVSGGVIGWVIAGVASGIFFGYQVYKARKGLNGIFCKVK